MFRTDPVNGIMTSSEFETDKEEFVSVSYDTVVLYTKNEFFQKECYQIIPKNGPKYCIVMVN